MNSVDDYHGFMDHGLRIAAGHGLRPTRSLVYFPPLFPTAFTHRFEDDLYCGSLMGLEVT